MIKTLAKSIREYKLSSILACEVYDTLRWFATLKLGVVLPVVDILCYSRVSNVYRLHALLLAVDVAYIVVVFSLWVRWSDTHLGRVVADVELSLMIQLSSVKLPL